MTQAELKTFLQKPFVKDEWLPLLRALFKRVDIFATPQQLFEDQQSVKKGGQFGMVQLEDGKSIALFEVEVADTVVIERNRVALRGIAAKYIDQHIAHGALVFYYSQKQPVYRFSFISKQTQFDEFGQLTKTETHPKRFTYLFGKGENTRTAESRLVSLQSVSSKRMEDVLEAFSVEKVSKEFFTSYKQHYYAFCQQLYESTIARDVFVADDKATQEKLMRDFAKRLMGRLVFLYFLQKKGWLGCPSNTNKTWQGGDPNFIANLFASTPDPERFHSRELTRLFFKTLNERRQDDQFQMPDGRLVRIPYLNGGLFDNDWPEANGLDFSADWFRTVFDFFNQYNFTIDESSPNDHAVGIDPEMLGHIFENLLEENREKGAIYTPKEIVHFMCQQSLSEFLVRKFEHRITESELRAFVNTKEIGGISKSDLAEILTCLDNIRICDPAIGSGAFPMGILQEIYAIKEAIYLETKGLKSIVPAKLKSEIIQKSIFGVDIDSGAVDIARLRFWLSVIVDEEEPQELPNLDYKIMQGNSLLESFEDIDLSQLTEINEAGVEDVVFANKQQFELGAEFSKTKQTLMVFDRVEKDELYRKIDAFFDQRDPEVKKSLKSEINLIIDGRIQYLLVKDAHAKEGVVKSLENTFRKAGGDNFEEKFSSTKNKDFKKYLKLKQELAEIFEKEKRLIEIQHGEDRPFFLWKVYFYRVFQEGGFDIVIANPPYMRVQEIEKSFPREKKQYEETLPNGKPRFEVAKGAYDLANLFFEMTVKKLSKPDGVNCFIFPHKFFNAGSSEAFRDFLMTGKYVDRIAHFGANRVFNDVDTYVCVALFSARENDGFALQTFPFRSDFTQLMLDENRYQRITYQQLNKAAQLHGSNQWLFFDTAEEYEVFEKIYRESKRFEEVFEIFVGLQTSYDKLYFLDIERETEVYYFGKNQLSERVWQVEKAFFKPILKGRDVHRFAPLQTQTYVFFPYIFSTNEKGKEIAKPVPLNLLKEDFPFTHAFVLEQADEFKNRERGKAAKMEFWYEYIYPKNLVKFDQLKLSSMEICTSFPNVTLNEGRFYHNTKVYSWVKNSETEESYEYLLAIANSSLMWWFLKNTGDTLQGDARTLKTTYLNPFPIPKEVSKEHEAAISQVVRYLMWLNAGNPSGLSISNGAVEQNFRQVLDACVCELYFGEEMAGKSVEVLRFVAKDLGDFYDQIVTGERIVSVFKKWQQPDSEVRNRLKLMTIRLPELLKPIIESTQPYQK